MTVAELEWRLCGDVGRLTSVKGLLRPEAAALTDEHYVKCYLNDGMTLGDLCR